MSLNNTILSVSRRSKNGLTVGEIFDRVCTQLDKTHPELRHPPYNSVRARVYELRTGGSLRVTGSRPDSTSGRRASTFALNS